ncbi:MAG: hypothetical protein ABEL51_12450 [Salinibacter sp.]
MSVLLLATLPLTVGLLPETGQAQPLSDDQEIRGWNILTDSVESGLTTIERAAEYDINHLQISHQTIMDLRHVRDEDRLAAAKTLTNAAHDAGIQEVAYWDHALYPLDYYPDRFKTGPNGTIDLDDPAFWEWLKDDYREMLEIAPDIEALILTFIETGARVENQHSDELETDAEKLAAVVNAVADVVIDEHGMNLYARTFAYDQEEYDRITSAIELFEHEEVRLMMKETPHDFLMPHPPDFFVGEFDRPTLVEFDPTGEFHGQGIVLNTFPEVFLDRAAALHKRDHVAGYVARMDRYGDTHIVNRPTEINAKAIDMYFKNPTTTSVSDVYEAFIKDRYGEDAYPMLNNAFRNGRDITLSMFYTLNTSTANHSRLNYDPYSSNYARHVSGRWLDPPTTYVPRGVNKEFHYWTDIINTLAPEWAKKGGAQLNELTPQQRAWLDEKERMNEEYLRYVLQEKDRGVALANENLDHLEAAKPHLTETQYEDLYHHFQHTLLTMKLHRETAAAYWGFRVYARGEEHRSDYVVNTLDRALDAMLTIADKIENYPVKPPQGQWTWSDDAEMARQYHEWITETGWPEDMYDHSVSFGGETYP